MIGVIASLVRDSVPSYLESVPIPRSFKGFLDLSFKDWIHLILFSGVVGTTTYYAAKPYIEICRRKKAGLTEDVINQNIKKDCSKVADVIDIESLGEKAAFCRCWRSKKFPFCDGSHNKHNELSGDNVGPVCIKKAP